jgi:hypothetical protein
MKLSQDKIDILNNVIAGGILIHYGALLANLVFFSNQGWLGLTFNVLSIIVWVVLAIRFTK